MSDADRNGPEAHQALRRIEWMLTKTGLPNEAGQALGEPTARYGDLVQLNTCRVILDAVGREVLADIAGDYLDLLDTAAAVYEKNGDYALGIFTSSYCRFMDLASRQLCGTSDDRAALGSGRWFCHESCWNQASKASIDSGAVVDIECAGGLRIHAAPIRAGGEIVGSINFGYGDPPRDRGQIAALAETFGVNAEELAAHARAYESRPPFIVELAKRRLDRSARLIGEIVQRRRLERLQQESEEKYRQLFEIGPDALVFADSGTAEIHEVNDAALSLYGFSREEMLHRRVFDFSAQPAETAQALRDAPPRIPLRLHRRKDGTVFPAELTTRTFEWRGRRMQFAAIRDVTERAALELERARISEQLALAQKQESIGRLAGGVAHDFNNMLAVILGHVDLGLAELDPSHPLAATLGEIKRAAQRSSGLTKQLLAFARKQTVAPKVLDLNCTLEGMLSMLQRLIGEDIELVWRPGPGVWTVNVDPSQVDQILANLCVNARDAIAGHGTLTIETGNAVFDEAHCAANRGALCGQFVVLTVTDDGAGMDKETLEHLFEPFFTTKEIGRGTGLGLSTVYGIVRQNGGFIDVNSEPGAGSVFRVYLPRYLGSGDGPHSPSPPSPPGGEGELVLLVEDEVAILAMCAAMLERLGYTVLAASSPGEGLRLALAHAGRLRLLITDVIMPEMNGRELASAVRAIAPACACLYVSGYTADVIAHHGVLEEGVAFLQKPFSLAELGARVRDSLDRRRPSSSA